MGKNQGGGENTKKIAGNARVSQSVPDLNETRNATYTEDIQYASAHLDSDTPAESGSGQRESCSGERKESRSRRSRMESRGEIKC